METEAKKRDWKTDKGQKENLKIMHSGVHKGIESLPQILIHYIFTTKCCIP